MSRYVLAIVVTVGAAFAGAALAGAHSRNQHVNASQARVVLTAVRAAGYPAGRTLSECEEFRLLFGSFARGSCRGRRDIADVLVRDYNPRSPAFVLIFFSVTARSVSELRKLQQLPVRQHRTALGATQEQGLSFRPKWTREAVACHVDALAVEGSTQPDPRFDRLIASLRARC